MSDQKLNIKEKAELSWWSGHLGEHGVGARTSYYQQFMMSMGNIEEPSFFDGLICLDIGCGPMGSLTWLPNARAAIGLDPLAQSYMRFDIREHDMLYLQASAESIPLPGAYVDVVLSMNSLDHVDNFFQTCQEIRRVLRPGGYFIGSINLYEPATPTEPWSLTEEMLEVHLFAGWTREYYQIRPKVEDGVGDPYRYFFEPCPEELEQQPGPRALWCRLKTGAE